MNILLMGFGYTAKNFVKQYPEYNYTTTYRSALHSSQEIYQAIHINDLIDLSQYDYIVISIPPKANILHKFDLPKGKTVYLSSTSVYGNYDGKWVDENSELKAIDAKSIIRKRDENIIQQQNGYILRLSGIYGDKRNYTTRKMTRVNKENQYFNRIHVDDICGFINHIITNDIEVGIYNLSDDYPCDKNEIIEYICDKKAISYPPLVEVNDASLLEMTTGFYANNKKVSNKKARSTGFNLKYKSYKDYYEELLN